MVHQRINARQFSRGIGTQSSTYDTSILTIIDTAGLAIGFALRGTLQNIAAEIMLLLLRPAHFGDVIE